MATAEPQLLSALTRCVWDVVVVGAGPAGSIAAHALSHRGLAVLLIDRAAFPRSKVCGCCLNPQSLQILTTAGLGELAARCGAGPVRQMRLAAGGKRASVKLPGWQVLSRARLDLALVEAAGAAGTQFLPETEVALGPEEADRRVAILLRRGEQVEIGARLILAADGLGSRLLRGEEGCTVQIAEGSRIRAGTAAASAPDYYEPGIIHMAYGPGGYVGLVRLEDNRLNIAAALDADYLKKLQSPGKAVDALLRNAGWPDIPELTGLTWQGTPPLTRRAVRPAGTRVFAIGDAGGYVEPFTGEGIGWAIASGRAVAPLAERAVRNWRPELVDEWSFQASQIKTRSSRLCRAVTWVSRRPTLAQGLIELLGRMPWLASPLVKQIGL